MSVSAPEESYDPAEHPQKDFSNRVLIDTYPRFKAVHVQG